MCHAAGESSPGNLAPGTYAVVLGCSSEQLCALERQLQLAGVPHAAIRENDAPYYGELMAIGVCPALKKEVKPYVSSLPLLR